MNINIVGGEFMNAVIGAIIENMQQIKIVFEPTPEAFVKDTKHTGDIKEVTVKEFLESFLPNSFAVKKGPIFNLDTTSQEIDCVILAPNHPKLITPKREVILAEGVFAAVEVKPDISTLTEKSEFHRALVQIQSVKRLKRDLQVLFTEGDVPDEILRIPCVIFSNKSRSALSTIEYMKECVANGTFDSKELPDLIVSLDKGIIFHSKYIEKTLFNNWVKQQSNLHNGEKYIYLKTTEATTLSMFLLILLCFREPEPPLYDHIIKEYIKQGIGKLEFEVIEP